MERGAVQNKLRQRTSTTQVIPRRTTGTTEKKLRRKTGATLVLAMAVLLAAVMFSMVIITGSINAAKAAWDQYSLEQSYLCVSAAARMLNREILQPTGMAAEEKREESEEKDEGEAGKEKVKDEGNTVHRYTAAITRDGVTTDNWPTLGGLQDFLKFYGFCPGDETIRPLYRPAQTSPLTIRELLSLMYEQCETGEGWKKDGISLEDSPNQEFGPSHNITITLPLDGTRGRVVNVELTMYARVRQPYSLTVALSAGDGTGADAGTSYPDYTMRLEYECTVHETEAERRETHYTEEEDGTLTPDYWESAKVTTTTLEWTLKKVGRGNMDAEEEETGGLL